MEDIESKLKNLFLLTSCFTGIKEYRDTVVRKCGIRLEIRTKEQGSDNIPHCHAYYQGQYISISLIDFSILETNLRFEQTKKAVLFAQMNKDLLFQTWEKYHGLYHTII